MLFSGAGLRLIICLGSGDLETADEAGRFAPSGSVPSLVILLPPGALTSARRGHIYSYSSVCC